MTAAAPRPNVLFILSDQHNAKVLGHRSHPDVRTPHLDRLAAEGVRFENAIAQNPICTPSRMCYLSGQYCHNHGYYGLNGPHPEGLPTILGHFRRAGYTTAAIGKIHCPEYWVEDDSDYFRELYPNCSIGGCPEYTAYLTARGALEDRDDYRVPEHPEAVGVLDARASRLSYDDPREMFPQEYPQGFGELYDLEADPWEMRNLYFEERFQATVRELREDLLNWIVTTARPATVLWYNTEGYARIPDCRLRFHVCVNADGKVSPHGLRDLPAKIYL